MKEYKILSQKELDEQMEYASRVKDNIQLSGEMKYACVLTFGCQQNEADSEKIAGLCKSMGYEICKSAEDASLVLVNTCAIREHAEKKALSIIGQFKHLKAKNPDMLIGVCGCMVTQEHRKEEIKHSYPYVDFVFGTSSLYRLPELVYQKTKAGKRIFCPEENEYSVFEGVEPVRESNYRAWVSIMYGCNNFCTYCIVPYVRGRERSRRPEDIISEVKDLVSRGYKDITLLGQNVNSYGKDVTDMDGHVYDFADLVADIDKIEGDYYLHFMTSHPKDASFKLIDVMASSKHVARQFHLPLQSGSDRILGLMNRHYDTERYLSCVEYMREKIPDITLSTDIIVGFPGESEEDFEATLNILDKVGFDMIYSFIYSPRKGTPAAQMENQIPEKEKSERFDRLLALQNQIALEKNKPLEGKVLRILCDGESKNNSEVYSGRTQGNKIVMFDKDIAKKGEFVELKIDRADTFALYGSLPEKPTDNTFNG